MSGPWPTFGTDMVGPMRGASGGVGTEYESESALPGEQARRTAVTSPPAATLARLIGRVNLSCTMKFASFAGNVRFSIEVILHNIIGLCQERCLGEKNWQQLPGQRGLALQHFLSETVYTRQAGVCPQDPCD